MNHRRRLLLLFAAWAVLLIVAWGLWLWRLDASDLTYDEAATYQIAHRSFSEIISYLRSAIREHPPVYYLLMHVWMGVAGSSEFSLRFFSVGAALVALALTGWLARQARLPGWPASGLLPGVLLLVTPGMAYYARDARMYTLVVVWAVLSAGLFLRDWLPKNEWPRRASLVALAVVHLLALFTHYYLLFPILVQPIVLLVTRRWRPCLAWCAAHGLPVVAGLLWLLLAPGLRTTGQNVWQGVALTIPTRSQVLYLLGKLLFSPIVRVRFSLLYCLLALAGVGLAVAIWRRRAVGVWLLLALLLPLGLSFQIPKPPEPRYVLFLIPFLVLALGFFGAAPLWLRRRWPAWLLSAGLLAGMAVALVAGGLYPSLTLGRSRYGHTLETIKVYARRGDVLLFYGPWQLIQFNYYNPGGLPGGVALPRHAPPLLSPEEARPVLERLLRYKRIWVLPAAVDDVDPPHFVERWLRTHAHPVWQTDDFTLYLPPLPADAPSQPVQAVLGETLRVEDVVWEPTKVRAGDALRLTLHWSALRTPEEDVRLSLRLTDAAGHVWAQALSTPGAWAHPSSQWQPGEVITDYEGLMVPRGTPPGWYTVRLLVTDQSGGNVYAATESDDVALFPVRVSSLAAKGLISTTLSFDLPNADATTFCPPGSASCLQLAGYEPGGLRFQQGHLVPLTLHWATATPPLPELQLLLQIVHLPLPGLSGQVIVSKTLPLSPAYPASRWPADRLVTLPASLTLPPDAAAGRARVTLEVLAGDGSPWLAANGQPVFSLFDLVVERRPTLRRLPGGLTRVQADLGAEVGLRGYRVDGDARPGGQLQLTYAWYARTRPTAIYAVFNHLIAADGSPVAQQDGWPQEGRVLTTQWQPGEYVEDHYTLVIPAGAPPGPYRLVVGMYNATTTDRLPAVQDGQRLLDDQLPIPLGVGSRE